MSYEPPSVNWHHPIISPLHEAHQEGRIIYTGGPVSTAWPVANLCIYVPIYVYTHVKVYSLWWSNGSVVSGNACMGLYDESGSRIAETGVVAQSGTNAPQEPSITAFDIPPGRYFAGLAVSNTTGHIRSYVSSGGAVANSDLNKSLAIGEESVTGTQVPATMNPSASARILIPAFGLRTVSQAL